MKANQAMYPVVTMCRVLELSPSGYYAWSDRAPSRRAIIDEVLLGRIGEIHACSRATYGAPRVHAELAAQSWYVGRKRVARPMRQAGLRGVCRRKWITTTVRWPDARPAPDLVERRFAAQAPDRLWVADITYIATWTGFVYLAIVLDAFNRRIVGWAMASHLRSELVLAALDMALGQRRPGGDVVHHSDQGTQYTSIAFGKRCEEMGVRPSMGSVGDAYDNAMAESFFASLETELLERRRFKSQAEAQVAVFDWIEGWYNVQRRHSGIGYHSPIGFERRYEQHQVVPRPITHRQSRPRARDAPPAPACGQSA